MNTLSVVLTCVDSHVWICLLCKLPFRNHTSYQVHHRSKHTAPESSYKYSCAHCGRRFRQSSQLRLHKCRPENYASNVQKEMQQRNCHRSTAGSVQYIGPTFVRVQRHEDILAIVGDIFTACNDDEDAMDDACVGASINNVVT